MRVGVVPRVGLAPMLAVALAGPLVVSGPLAADGGRSARAVAHHVLAVRLPRANLPSLRMPPVVRVPVLPRTHRHLLTLTVGGLVRRAVEVVPKQQSGPLPLLVVLHGRWQTPYRAELAQGWDRLAASAQALVVYGAGYAGSWNAGACCGPAARRQVDDTGYLQRLITLEEQRHPVDRQRVYMVGFSNGGMLAYHFACLHADELAGVAVVAGALEDPRCHPSRSLPLLDVQGDRDRVVPYAGSPYSPAAGAPTTSVPDSLLPWRQLCDRDVRLVRLPHAGHEWPTLRHGGWNASTQVWRFLRVRTRTPAPASCP
jgi:poly(3-hydroxybutyrate) depolymerase